jgi:hypothetical protein
MMERSGKNSTGGVVPECVATEIAELIEAGLELELARGPSQLVVQETPGAFLYLSGGICHAGALGLAFLGRIGNPRVALDQWLQVANASAGHKLEAAAALLGIAVALAKLVEINHRNGLEAAQVARSLRLGVLGIAFRGRHSEPASPGAKAEAKELSESFPLDSVRG